MDVAVGAALAAAWIGLGATIVACGVRARRSDRALKTGIAAISVLWVAAGAAVNVGLLLSGADYSGFADASPIPFVHDRWESLVVPHHHLFIGLLAAGEALAGLLVLVPGRARELALLVLVAFNATLVVFGWGFAVWAVPLVTGLLLLYRAERVTRPRRRPSADASSASRHRSLRSRVPSP